MYGKREAIISRWRYTHRRRCDLFACWRYLWKECCLKDVLQGYTCCSLAGEHGSAASWQIASQIRIVLVYSFFKSGVTSQNKKANFPLLMRGRAWRTQRCRLSLSLSLSPPPTWGPIHWAPLQEALAETFRCFANFHLGKLFIWQRCSFICA
jgi:hypothetical protein